MKIKKWFLHSTLFYKHLEKELNIKKRKNLFPLYQQSISKKQIILFYSQLSSLLKAGLPLLEAISILFSQQKKNDFKNTISKIHDFILKGNYLSQALLLFPRHFDSLSVSVIEAGEVSGCLEDTLFEIARYHQNIENLKNKFIKMMSYPALLFLSMGLVLIYLFFGVIPHFESFFSEINLSLPPVTRVLFLISHFFHSWLFCVFIIFLFLVILLFLFPYRFLFLKFPGIKKMYDYQLQSRLAYVLSMVLNAGLPLSEALTWATKSVREKRHKQYLLQIKKAIFSGYTLTQSLQQSTLFGPDFIQILAVGENTGSLADAFRQAMRWLIQENERFLSRFFTFFEPCLLLVLGILILLLILAIYMPLFEMMNSF